MNAIPYDRPDETWDDGYEDERMALPGRPRRQMFTRATAVLCAALLTAAGFYAGVRVEKSQLSSGSSSAAGQASLLAGTGAAGARAGGVRSASGAGGGGGFARLFGGGSGGELARGAAGSFGTVSSISGNTLYVTDATGNTIRVTLSSATKVTKSVGVSKHAVRPGDAVVIQGLRNSNGSMQAATVSDTGARSAGAGAGVGSRSGSVPGSGSGSGSTPGSGSGGASSAVNSLFGSGG